MENVEKIFDARVESIISIAEKIIQRHTALGPASPLKNMVIAELNARISAARQKHDEGEKYKRLMNDAWRDRDLFLGMNEKSVHHTLKGIAHILGNEKHPLDDWGFPDE